jgi:hypothetical protein
MNSLIKTDKTQSKAFSCRELQLLVKEKSVVIRPLSDFIRVKCRCSADAYPVRSLQQSSPRHAARPYAVFV